jgi:orotate phosphoribosyltransferase
MNMTIDFVSEIASFLLKSNALQFGVFKLASGNETSYYIDLRILPSFPTHFRLAIDALKDKLTKDIGLDFDTLGSVPTSGLIFGSALAYEVEKPLIYVRKDSKAHGTSKMVEGYLKPGAKVILVDDVITTGMSMSNAIEVIRANGGIVENVLAIVNRLEGAQEKLKKMNIKLSSVTTIKDIVSILHKKALIDDNTLESVIKQKMDDELEIN